MATVRASRAIANSELSLRNSLWPDAPERLWDRTANGGFMTLPKTFPLVARIMDDLSKGFPLSTTYLALWSATWDNAFVRLNRPSDLAFAAGFSGERAERTWTDRMKRLEALGFIETKPSGAAKMGFAFIPNPHEVIFLLHRAKSDPSAPVELRKLAAGLAEGTFNAFVERALEIGCNDVKAMLAAASAPAAPSPPTSPRPKIRKLKPPRPPKGATA